MRLLSAPPKVYTNTALWSLAMSQILQRFYRVFPSFSIYCPVVVSALRQRQELGRGQSFLCHTRFCTTDRIYIPERCPSYLTLSRAINDIDISYMHMTTLSLDYSRC